MMSVTTGLLPAVDYYKVQTLWSFVNIKIMTHAVPGSMTSERHHRSVDVTNGSSGRCNGPIVYVCISCEMDVNLARTPFE